MFQLNKNNLLLISSFLVKNMINYLLGFGTFLEFDEDVELCY